MKITGPCGAAGAMRPAHRAAQCGLLCAAPHSMAYCVQPRCLELPSAQRGQSGSPVDVSSVQLVLRVQDPFWGAGRESKHKRGVPTTTAMATGELGCPPS